MSKKKSWEKKPMDQAEEEMYVGDRGEAFRALLTSVLKKGKVVPEYINLILDEEGMKTFDEAFTSASFNPTFNYEMLEQLGDVMANCAIKWYMTRRFPVIRCPEGVGTGSLLLINYGSKQSFYGIAEGLGFWPFISASVDERRRGMKPLLEDVFEAFIGAVVETIDKRTRNGVGYSIVYDIIESVFDEKDISLTEDDLKDTKTWLKECLDTDKRHGAAEYLSERKEVKNAANPGKPMYITIATVYQLRPEKTGAKFSYKGVCDRTTQAIERARGEMDSESAELAAFVKEQKDIQREALATYKKQLIWLGEGEAALKKDAEKKAAKVGIETLKRRGITKKVNGTFDSAAGQLKDDREGKAVRKGGAKGGNGGKGAKGAKGENGGKGAKGGKGARGKGRGAREK